MPGSDMTAIAKTRSPAAMDGGVPPVVIQGRILL
jgi:hypothetical protein